MAAGGRDSATNDTRTTRSTHHKKSLQILRNNLHPSALSCTRMDAANQHQASTLSSGQPTTATSSAQSTMMSDNAYALRTRSYGNGTID